MTDNIKIKTSRIDNLDDMYEYFLNIGYSDDDAQDLAVYWFDYHTARGNYINTGV